jgi:hypothetical protein
MQIDVAASAVIGREMEDDVDAADGLLDGVLIVEIGLGELHAARLDVPADVLEPAARESASTRCDPMNDAPPVTRVWVLRQFMRISIHDRSIDRSHDRSM